MKTCEEPDITKFLDDSRGMQGGFSQVLPLRELKIPLARTLHTFGRRRKYEPARLERSSSYKSEEIKIKSGWLSISDISAGEHDVSHPLYVKTL